MRLLRVLAGRDWGWSKELMRTTYMALIRSVMLFGVPAWGPWLSDTNWEKLEAVQRQAARVITGMVESSPCEALLEEAGLRELREVAESRWLVEYEKNLRRENEDPRGVLVKKEVNQRLKRKGWRAKCVEEYGNRVEEPVCRGKGPKMRAPWKERVDMVVDGEGSKGACKEKNKEMAERRLRLEMLT